MVLGLSPRPGQRVVYVDGAFDLFSSGHIAFLKQVEGPERKLGEERGWFEDSARQKRIADAGLDYGAPRMSLRGCIAMRS